MDYAGLLSQKRAEESRFRSGWDPIGSPTGLSRSPLGGDPYIGGGGLMAAESALQRLDSFSGGSGYSGGSFGGGYQEGSSSGGGAMNAPGYNIGNSGDPGNSRKVMQENYRRDLMKQAEEDRARKQAEREMERKEAGLVSTIYKPSFLNTGAGNSRSRRGSSMYGDDLAQQIEERRQKQELDRNNLLMFQQQQAGGDPLGFGGNARRRPHVSETSFDRSQRSQGDSVQATLQQQIADKKQREAERKRMEAEEDAALDARLQEQQRKVREQADREREAREAKERGRLERQRLIEEQQKRSHDEAEALKHAARNRRQGSNNAAAAVNDWGNWSDTRPAGGSAPPAEDLWQKPVEEPPQWVPSPPPPPPPPVESKPDTPPPEIHPSHDTSDLKIGFNWDRSQAEQAEVRLDSPQLDDLAKRNRDRQRRLEERRNAGQ